MNHIKIGLLLFLITGFIVNAGQKEKVKVMDHSFYEEILFPGHDDLNAVWDLHVSGPYIYIALCAEAPYNSSAVLYRYDTRTGEKKIILNPDKKIGIDLETGVLPASKFHTAIRTMKDGRLFMVTHNTAPGRYQPYWYLLNMWHDPTGFSSRAFIYDQNTEVVTYKGIPIPNEDIYYGKLDKELNLYYASGLRNRTLYVLDLNDMSVTEIVNQPSWIAIVIDTDHMVYTYDNKGRIWKWDPFKKESTMTNLQMPLNPLLKKKFAACTFSWKDEDGWIYAAVQYNNRICRYKPNEGIMEDLGNPTLWNEDLEHNNPYYIHIWAPVKAPNGKIYFGSYNQNRPLYDGAEVVEFDPETRKSRSLGTMHLSDGTNASIFGEGALGADGRIYWGDGNHGKRPAMMWAFDPSKVPDDYVPAEEVEKVSNSSLPKKNYILTESKNKVWRLRPQVRVFPQFDPLADKSLSGYKIDTLSMMASGYKLWNNGIFSLSETYEGYIYGIAGGEDYHLFRVSENDFKLENLGRIPAKEKIYNGNDVVACKEGIFVIGEDLYRWNKKTGFTVFYNFEGEQLPSAIAKDKVNPYLYVLTEPDNILLVLNTEDWSKVKSFQLTGPVQSRWLVPLNEGGLIGFEVNSVVYKINKDLTLEKLEQRYPSLKGLEFISEVTSATVDSKGKVWGGTREGYLFSVDADNGNVVNHGKPGPYYLKGIVEKDGIIYSMSGGNFGETHLFTYQERKGFEDKGLVTEKLVNCSVKGDDGKIYLGEYSSSSSVLRFKEN